MMQVDTGMLTCSSLCQKKDAARHPRKEKGCILISIIFVIRTKFKRYAKICFNWSAISCHASSALA